MNIHFSDIIMMWCPNSLVAFFSRFKITWKWLLASARIVITLDECYQVLWDLCLICMCDRFWCEFIWSASVLFLSSTILLLASYTFCILLSCFDAFYISLFVIVYNMLIFLWLIYLFSYIFYVLMSPFMNIVDIGALLTTYMPLFLLISLIYSWMNVFLYFVVTTHFMYLFPFPFSIDLIVAPSHKSIRHEAVRAWLDSMSEGREEKAYTVLTKTHISAWQDYWTLNTTAIIF